MGLSLFDFETPALDDLISGIAYVVVGAKMLVLFHHLHLLASSHQHRPQRTSSQVGVKLGCKY